jgi:hypothetical protein
VVQRALKQAPASGRQVMQTKLPTLASVVNCWRMNTDTIGVYGNYYPDRAIVTILGNRRPRARAEHRPDRLH